MKIYIYPEKLRSNVKLWLWSVRDFIIICGGIILPAITLVIAATIVFFKKKER